MATTFPHKNQDFSDKPLADYFWIAGLDGQDLLDAYKVHHEERDSFLSGENRLSRAVGETIQEDAVAEERAESFIDSPTVSTKHSRQNSYQKLSRLSFEARSSIQSLDRLTHQQSVRSNATIRRVVSSSRQNTAPPSPGFSSPHAGVQASALLSDADFDHVMKKFANDRDAFYLDLNFKSEAVAPKPSKSIQRPRTRTQRIVAEELEPAPQPNRTLGSVRRHMSFKDMSSTKRQPSIARKLSTRSARRVSSYNSVMPMPQPLQASRDEHPLRRSFEPVLLDKYPRPPMVEELRRREPFPDYVPMFAFPNDIHIISSDTRPAAKWHEFFLTAADNSKTPAVCVIIWIPLDRKTADELEKRCEEWRIAHMTEAERELAGSLGERLAAERANLSRLLAKLPSAGSGTETRDELDDEIGVVEEKIALMSDMLKPLRHGAANRIEGLTDGDTGLWIPRAYGIMGRDQSMLAFWKEWLKAIIVPMMDGAVLRVPPSSPRVGMWQPLERYVNTICTQASLPISSRIQVEIVVRELRLYAKREARNELPGSRTTDLYPLFRCLTIPNIIVLFEYLLAESRIILVSTYTSLLKCASNALLSLLWPFEWSGVHIPVLPTRLMEVLEAPIPYICGVVRKNDNINPPQDDADFVMVDLDKNELHATAHPPSLPKQQRRKLMSMLYLAAPHQQTRGVPTGPPEYAYEAFPNDMFVSEHPSVFAPITPSTELGRLASLSSAQFGRYATSSNTSRSPVFNAFVQATPLRAPGLERPRTGSTARRPSHTGGSGQNSPVIVTFPHLPTTPQSKRDSGFALPTSLREKRSGLFDTRSRYTPSVSTIKRKASLTFVKHNVTLSQTSDISTFTGSSTYAPSTYAQSTLAASTVMPGVPYQPVRNTENTNWVEGHCMQWRAALTGTICSICNEKSDDGLFKCTDCPTLAHGRCASQICLPCPAAFYPDQIRIAFARLFTSMFSNYRKFMLPADAAQCKAGIREKFNVEAWIRSLPPDHAEYLNFLKGTQAFDGFVHERETKTVTGSDSIALFDALMSAKKSRSRGVRSSIAVTLGGRNPFAGRSHSGGVPIEYLSDSSSHVWRVVSTPHSSERAELGAGEKGREYRKVISRTPAKLEEELFPAPSTHKPPNLAMPQANGKRSLRHRLNGLNMHAP
ncbi:hypothetical protein LTR70_002980 [Exophiala xenobiotica]|uniref:Uncharacterized protein n=1 Tax=Lithohypha guttulata TaxID=1690604 RepID=A0ABR0K6Q2_9EURO|nr:hypothetical protein LTR24_006533 [Lithohypha guttulata]KAK5324350.1 hypothetical protein LTR70_002980 [Exophiala xenobiotica]